MKVSLSSLKEYIDINLSTHDLCQVLTLGGIEVDEVIENPLKFSNVVAATILEVVSHPNSDHLKVTKVSNGRQVLQVVCGADNCRAGMRVALAQIGAILYLDGRSVKITKSKLRGIESHGMLCAADELGLLDSADGILELSDQIEEGTDLKEKFNDTILQLSLTPNLGHAMSVYGIARDLSALLQIPVKFPSFSLEEEISIKDLIKVELLDPTQCQRYACRMLQGVSVGPSPLWLQKKLEQAGFRSVNNVVDVGNLILQELGQPLHIFDYQTIADHTLQITSKTYFSELETLDSMNRLIPPDVLMICDPEKPLAFAGVIGGKSSAVSDKTSDVLIEAAYFTPQSIRKSSKWLKTKTDASQRFEKGIDPNFIPKALDYAAYLLQKVAGGKIVKGMIDQKTSSFAPKKIICRLKRVNHILGTQLNPSDIFTILFSAGMHVTEQSVEQFQILVPFFRHDLNLEIDLIEEIARLYGYNNIVKTPAVHISSPLVHCAAYRLDQQLRTYLLEESLQEFITCNLISPDQSKKTSENTLPASSCISVLQPHSLDQSILRSSLLPGLLQVVKHNYDRENQDLSGFEIGKIYFHLKGEYIEQSAIGIILTGKNSPYHIDPKPRAYDFFDVKGIIENLCALLHVEPISFHPSHLHNFHPNRQAIIMCQDSIIGSLGELHPKHSSELGIEQRIYFAEINTEELTPFIKQTPLIKSLISFPGSERDWTITIADKTPVGSILEIIKANSSLLLEEITLLDLYKSSQIGNDRKNITFRLFYRDKLKTIAFEAVEKEHSRIVETVMKELEQLHILS
ncbi:Phenylalanine--tRNA ligase beta subunit [Candidatus Rhabdochlamydia oedothoracis]|uniref:Phenylalanine--tRNA ligase beta subunit n=1 Tax=Candidatus Rhabdochlamydia oedothoracis TaxID=2720720 RepID=A0ABX8UZI8_9BACT|nr:phenylalanine--tRNA ligase subunit beta [Candidatus Rhabdochlamydia sp. W815]KAG6558906.1 Phenylalanine--tRNA ligase beta subunit [Candidatus Rhabdochlamydia sp. W815]QYF48375.1 Phenylalanine--tRNA ligase beta subunit [Candidatus Rhabdochlamydia oedothoracis]